MIPAALLRVIPAFHDSGVFSALFPAPHGSGLFLCGSSPTHFPDKEVFPMKHVFALCLAFLLLLSAAGAEENRLPPVETVPDYVQWLLEVAGEEVGYRDGTNTAPGRGIPMPSGARNSFAGAWIRSISGTAPIF